jgi:hypothetical protein
MHTDYVPESTLSILCIMSVTDWQPVLREVIQTFALFIKHNELNIKTEDLYFG